MLGVKKENNRGNKGGWQGGKKGDKARSSNLIIYDHTMNSP